jgi:hypothetical protein
MRRPTEALVLVLALTRSTDARAAEVYAPWVVPGTDPGSDAQVQLAVAGALEGVLDVNNPMPNVPNVPRLFLRDGQGKIAPLTWRKDRNWLQQSLGIPGSGPRLVYGTAEYGPVRQKSGEVALLVCHLKTAVGGSVAAETPVGAALPLELIPVGKPQELRLRVLLRGKPAASVTVTITAAAGGRKKLTTDKDGLTTVASTDPAITAEVLASEPASGERDGKKYTAVLHYATLLLTK